MSLLVPKDPAKRSNVGSNKALTKAYISFKAPFPPFVPPFAKDLFTKFMKVLMETTQARHQEQLEPQEHLLKAKTLETYFRKSHIDCYHFCQQCKNYFKISSITGINHIPFATTFFRDTISLRGAQHKHHYKSVTLIIQLEFKSFLQKNLGDFQIFIDSI